MRETDLYPPVKAFLTDQGYDVKGEIDSCDLVAIRGEEPPVIVELKRGFSLALVFQGIDRQAITDAVYLAVPPIPARARKREALGLCRRLGLGLMTVRTGTHPFVEVLLDPAPYTPRKQKSREWRLLREFTRRVGDPATGGSNKVPVLTAYRQDALRCAQFLAAEGAIKAATVANATGVAKAGTLLRRDVYGWFERVDRGIYQLTPRGHEALKTYAGQIPAPDGTD